jgi:hypothetical protein
MTKDPSWWSDKHEGTWSRVKSAMKRDWDQTKADFTTRAKRHDIDQDAGDTVKQAVGKEAIPPKGVPNDKPESWDEVESSYRYGVGARQQFGSENPTWNEHESKLADEWTRLKNERTWEDVKGSVRRGWDYDDNK